MQQVDRVITGAAPAVAARAASRRRRRAIDAAARVVVSAGGLATVVGIVGIFGFICWEMLPLWQSPRATVQSTFQLDASAQVFAPATEEYREIMEVITAAGSVRFIDLVSGDIAQELPIPALAGRRIAAAVRAGKDHVLVATDDGQLHGLRVPFDVRRVDGKRQLRPRLVETGTWTLDPDGRPPRVLATSTPGSSGVTVVYAGEDGPPAMVAVTEKRDLFDHVQRSEERHALAGSAPFATTAVAVAGSGDRAYVGGANGAVQYWDLRDRAAPQLIDTVNASGGRGAITALALLIGDQSLVVGDAAGQVSVWFPVRDAARPLGWRLQQVHVFTPHTAAVRAIAVSPRDKRFLTADSAGQVWLRHSTTARTLLSLPGERTSLTALAFSPKANGAIAIDAAGRVVNWETVDPHPEVSLQTLFGRVWYEGYEQPEFVWQSTGGTDDFEPKLSLVPLMLGTMKGTLYAMLFAIPIAVFGALYTSQFAHPRMRSVVKPTVEIMAALPSVVLGFLAGLWLAPTLEYILPAVLAMLVLLPSLMLALGVVWEQLPVSIRSKLPGRTEVLVLLPLIVLGVYVCLQLNEPVERLLFGGDFRAWLLNSAGLRFDQRNCLVVGFAMGFAVIPIIFTISEDALSNVPPRLVSGSLALGATRWQTAMRVVVPTASPGIFSAIMIGFGRAVGETMIVLMATGNTPVLEWNLFTGMRTLSASIAVEIPEAPYGSTLYRVLFLAALLLFAATFVVNTVAELVRMRLRQRYQQL